MFLCVFNVEAALVDAARRGERGVFGQRRAVLHGAGGFWSGDECREPLEFHGCGEVFFLNW